MESYSHKILDHYRTPRHAGVLSNYTVSGHAENPACGDSMRFYAQIKEGVVVGISCQTFGCAPSVAAGSMLAEMAEGKRLDAIKCDAPAVEHALGGLPPIKKHAAVLAADAFGNLIREYQTTSQSH